MEEIRACHESGAAAVDDQRLRRAPGRRLQPCREAERSGSAGVPLDQIATFGDTAADMVTAITMTYVEEAVGVTRAAVEAGMPVAVSFTVETEGRLPSGQALGEAIEQVDAETGRGPAYYMLNCVHPSHFEGVREADGPWRDRIRGLRTNASTKSHAELDEATELDEGDPSRPRRPPRGADGETPRAQRARRVLWHRPPPRPRDPRRVAASLYRNRRVARGG